MKPFRVVVLATDGSKRVEELPADRLAGMQRLVGGYIEEVRSLHWPAAQAGLTALVNEDGIRLELPLNPHGIYWLRQSVAGPIVIVRVGRADYIGLRDADIELLGQLSGTPLEARP